MARYGRPKKNPPPNVARLAEQYARTCPGLRDIAAKFGVTTDTFYRWMAENPNIRLAIDTARMGETEKMFEKIKKKAEGGSISHADRWLRGVRHPICCGGRRGQMRG